MMLARRNVLRVVERMREQSRMLDVLVREGRIAIVGAMYGVVTGEVEFLQRTGESRVASGAGSTMDMKKKKDWAIP
jgi:carbonic anhydrase